MQKPYVYLLGVNGRRTHDVVVVNKNDWRKVAERVAKRWGAKVVDFSWTHRKATAKLSGSKNGIKSITLEHVSVLTAVRL